MGQRGSGRRTAVWVAGLVGFGVLTLLGMIGFLASQALPVADQWASVGSLVVGFSGLVISAASLSIVRREQRAAASVATRLQQDLIDQLAQAEQARLAAEAQTRGLNLRRPLSVRWSAADPAVMDRIAVIIGERVDATDEDLARQLYLSGQSNEIAEVFTRLPAGRLVVLGQPGAGKTVLAMQLVQDLLARRRPGQPVAVLLSVASWNPRIQHLHAWISARLVETYPALGARTGLRDTTVALHLVQTGRIIPVLDGLDEMALDLRAPAVRGINHTLTGSESLVLTSRVVEFDQVIRGRDQHRGRSSKSDEPAPAPLVGAAVVELLPLELDDIEVYLREATPARDVAKWDPVFDHLRRNPVRPLALALSTPLMTALARIAYSETAADPAMLLDERLAQRGDVEEHLLARLIPTVYADRPRADDRPGRWTAAQARSWLRFLAEHLDRTGGRDLAWWRLDEAVSRTGLIVTAGVLGAFAYGLLGGLAFAPLQGVADAPTVVMVSTSALAFGLAFGLLTGYRPGSTSSYLSWQGRLRHRLGRLVKNPAVTLRIGLLPGMVIGLIHAFSLSAETYAFHGVTLGFTVGLVDAFAVTVPIVLVLMFVGGPASGAVWLAVRIAAGLAGGLALAATDRFVVTTIAEGPGWHTVGLVPALVIGVLVGLTTTLTGRLTRPVRPILFDFARIFDRLTVGLLGALTGGLAGGFVAWTQGGYGGGFVAWTQGGYGGSVQNGANTCDTERGTAPLGCRPHASADQTSRPLRRTGASGRCADGPLTDAGRRHQRCRSWRRPRSPPAAMIARGEVTSIVVGVHRCWTPQRGRR